MAASELPIPQPPRTPSPLSDDDRSLIRIDSNSSSMYDQPPPLSSGSNLHPNSLSPMTANTLHPPGSAGSLGSSVGLGLSGTASMTEGTNNNTTSTNEATRNPFSFQTQTYVAGKPSGTSNVGQRRGHKYKHSSVSHQLILEPAPTRGPLRLPASLPIPTLRESWSSMTVAQTLRVVWCCCHLFVAGYVQWTAQGSLALTALSHLVFYDAAGAFLAVIVDVLSNFEVWKRPTIRQPFGLERSEVLTGFALSILLLFMGFDLISHNAGHILDSSAGQGEEAHTHHEHHHERVTPGSVDLTVLLAIAATVVSALMLNNHSRIAKAMRFASIKFLPAVLCNPSHLLTLGCSGVLLLMPLLSIGLTTTFDRVLSTFMACFMCLLGFQLVKTLGAMLLMSYSGNEGEIGRVMYEIETDPNVESVEEAKFWQVHYGLCMANLKLRARGTEDQATKLRERVTSLIKNRLGGGYGGGNGVSWEVSTQLTLDKS